MTGDDASKIPSGFEFLQMRRDGLHHWHVLSRLSQIGKNREAAAIVESFQRQIELDSRAIPTEINTAA
ncbi:MAG TPA: hypothetical protein V6C76_02970 [Drouetiella sp.]